jgi:hypothetical protein
VDRSDDFALQSREIPAGFSYGEEAARSSNKKLIVLEALEVGVEVVESARSFESRLSHPQT